MTLHNVQTLKYLLRWLFSLKCCQIHLYWRKNSEVVSQEIKTKRNKNVASAAGQSDVLHSKNKRGKTEAFWKVTVIVVMEFYAFSNSDAQWSRDMQHLGTVQSQLAAFFPK